jgi:hypothetical protein
MNGARLTAPGNEDREDALWGVGDFSFCVWEGWSLVADVVMVHDAGIVVCAGEGWVGWAGWDVGWECRSRWDWGMG